MAAQSTMSRLSHFISAPDGLRLYYFEYGSKSDPATPVVCLPGLARTAEDFDHLARVLAAGRPRRILALDYRGRGRSAWDPDWTHYSLPIEQMDILTTLAAAEVTNAIVIGTSRGGLHAMLLAATQPSRVRAIVVNDIGPVIEQAGLERIKSYVGKPPPLASLKSWTDAIAWMRKIASTQFTEIAEADWEAYARLTFTEENGQFRLRYDPALALAFEKSLAELANPPPDKPPPDPWPAYDALAKVPILGIRGENSDILSAATFAEMARRHPNFTAVTVKGQGHAPLLLDGPTISAIEKFVGRFD